MAQKLCPSCGAALQENVKFCRLCGAPVSLLPREAVSVKRRTRHYFVLASSLTLVFLTVLGLGLLGHRVFLKKPSGASEEAVIQPHNPPPSASSTPSVNELLALASADIKGGKLNEAIAKLDRAIELEPSLAEAHKMRADALVGSTRYPEAAESYEKAFTLDSSQIEAGLQAGKLYERTGQSQKAVDIYTQLLQAKPELSEARWQLARLLRHKGRVDEARAHYEQLIQDSTYSARARQELEKLKSSQENTRTPETGLAAEQPKPVVSAEELISRGMKAYNASDPQGALREYKAALSRAPGNQDVHYLMGLAYEKLGDLEAALQSYRNCRSGIYSKVASQHVERLSKKLRKR